jgi:hypothetical protein
MVQWFREDVPLLFQLILVGVTLEGLYNIALLIIPHSPK